MQLDTLNKPPMRAPGIYPHVSDNEYHDGPEDSSSTAKVALQSLMAYRYHRENGNKDSYALFMGRLVHLLALEPERAMHDIHIVEATTRTTKIYKSAVAEYPAKTVVLSGDFDRASEIARTVREHEQVCDNAPYGDLFKNASIEHSLYWNEGGLMCKARPDIWLQDRGIIADLKTCQSAAPEDFARDAAKYKYPFSAAWYMRGIHAVTGRRPAVWLWIAVEKTPPYQLQVYEADVDMLRLADKQCDLAIARIRTARERNEWPAYGTETLPLTLPAWAFN